jgi:FMN phosphatase YigB (HAD superfamily)
VSNLTQPGWEAVERRLNVSQYFDHLHLSWQQERCKPDPVVWQTVRGWYPDTQEFWMVGDSLEDDLLVPQGMGWEVFQVKDQRLGRLRWQLALTEMDKEGLWRNG